MNRFWTELKHAVLSVLPVVIVVGILHFTLAPMPRDLLILFSSASCLLVLGVALFSLGAETAMMPIGQFIGSHLTRTNKLIILLPVAFILGFMVTIAEPDLQILANQIPSIPNSVLIPTVAAGVGLFLGVALLRIRFRLNLAWLLIGIYTCIFIIAWFAPHSFTALAFDSGGVTTGPITVPFILALNVGLASVLSSSQSRDASFGMVALCSAGPILAVLMLGVFYHPDASAGADAGLPLILHNFLDLVKFYLIHFPAHLRDVGFALIPIAVVFLIFQFALIRLTWQPLVKLGIGLVYTFFGLVLFLASANIGFLPAARFIGETLATLPQRYLLLPISAVLGFFIVAAEPAVAILNHQIWDMTGGAISQKAVQISLSIGVAFSAALAVTRLLFDFSIWYLLLPGYALALLLTFFTPPLFTAIAFDSGGVASGPMAATFLLPFTAGICSALGGDALADTFGVVAMVAMTPLITVQILGMIYKYKLDLSDAEETETLAAAGAYADEEYVDLEYEEADGES